MQSIGDYIFCFVSDALFIFVGHTSSIDPFVITSTDWNTCQAQLGYKEISSSSSLSVFRSSWGFMSPLGSFSLLKVVFQDKICISFNNYCLGCVDGVAVLNDLPVQKEVLQSHPPKVNVSGLRSNNLVHVDPITPDSRISGDDRGVSDTFKNTFFTWYLTS